MTKSNGVWNVILKFLTRVRNHPEELLVLQNFITVLFLMSKVLYCLQSKKQENEIFGPRSSSGWVLTYVRTFNLSFSTTFDLIIWSQNWFFTLTFIIIMRIFPYDGDFSGSVVAGRINHTFRYGITQISEKKCSQTSC